MKKLSFIALLLFIFHLSPFTSHAQQAYWVFLADKAGTTFDPYAYFDAKAIERYQQCGADLYDITNYPVNASYEQGVSALATEEIGASRWMNALGVMATPDQIAAIEALPYVLRVQHIAADGLQLASATQPLSHSVTQSPELPGLFDIATVDGPLEAQLVRMGGQHFRDKGFDGKGIRIAVFDGGFPQVNTHMAFKHLRDNHQILKTWNFPKDKEDVYGWNSHGTMTLSCIAGRMGDRDLGLATGAEFLLARTEINSEPFKEEVWWQMAVEWADRNGANIISSSLGYGKERHYTKDMDGTSYVAKAGNLAARKGMLVVNSAGNEADDKQWKTIITPADADSVLCVGGIENSLTEYNHIEFSSFGPSADGRLKPNVCAFGYARTANTGKDTAYHYVHGTSFSCPLVAGFAACAWQASPGKTAMEMFHLIEQSADLYPYADYSFGYGVPQADFFTQSPSHSVTQSPSFHFVSEADTIRLVPTRPVKRSNLFYAFRRPDDHRLTYYGKLDIAYMDQGDTVTFSKNALFNRTLIIHLDGYTDSLTLSRDEYVKYQGLSDYTFWPEVSDEAITGTLTGRNGDLVTSQWGSNNTWRWNLYFGLGLPIKIDDAELTTNFWSPSTTFGVRILRAFSKAYCLGVSLDFTSSHYRFNDARVNDLEGTLGMTQNTLNNYKDIDTRKAVVREYGLEIFQRVRLVPGGMIGGNGLHWDLGIYGSFATNSYTFEADVPTAVPSEGINYNYSNLDALTDYRWNFGVVTRLVNDWYGIYVRYRLNGLGSDPAVGKVLLPRLTVGLLLQL